jgi:hypothetical protein
MQATACCNIREVLRSTLPGMHTHTSIDCDSSNAAVTVTCDLRAEEQPATELRNKSQSRFRYCQPTSSKTQTFLPPTGVGWA